MSAKRNNFKPAMATDSDYEENQRNIKDTVIKAADSDLLIRCACGCFCSQVVERNSVILFCEYCGNEDEFKYLSFKNVNRSAKFQAQYINEHDSVKCFEQSTGLTHSSKMPLTA